MNSLARLSTATLIAAIAVAGLSGSAWARGGAKASSFTYSLSPGACTAAENVPVTNLPVQVIGSQITAGQRGVSQMTLLAVPSNFLEWIGTDFKTGAITEGFSSSAGTHMIYVDWLNGYVDLQVASATQVQVCNSASGPSPAAGTVTFIY